MEKRRSRREFVVDSGPKNEAPKSSSQVTFSMFFAKCVREGKLKSWQHKEVEAFFKDFGLREKEDLELYETTLKKY